MAELKLRRVRGQMSHNHINPDNIWIRVYPTDLLLRRWARDAMKSMAAGYDAVLVFNDNSSNDDMIEVARMVRAYIENRQHGE